MARLSRRKRSQIKALGKLHNQRSKESRPVRISIVMVGGKGEPITVEQEKIVDGWVEKENWLEASNISLLYEQGHKITEEQKDIYDAWQLAKRDIMKDRRKNSPYRRSDAYHVEMIANPELSRECPCCGLTYTVSRLHTSNWIKKCMMCQVSCSDSKRKNKGCSLTSKYVPHEHPTSPFSEAFDYDRDDPFPPPKVGRYTDT